MEKRARILVTGATGYIGGNLVPLLLSKGYQVCCYARDVARLSNQDWFSQVEAFEGDVTNAESLDRAMEGVSAAYYLIHNMASGSHYHEREIIGANNFAASASKMGVQQIIYLGGLANPKERIGTHLRSRLQTGEVLRQGTTPVTEFRSGPIVGSGSISFEMIRYLTEMLPIMIGPDWLKNRAQPIAVQDVLEYLLSALETPSSRGRIYEIGGGETLTYAQVMLDYARLRGLKRVLITLPVIPVWLMAFFVDKLTPVPLHIASPLIEGMRGNSLVQSDMAYRDFPHIQPLDYSNAVQVALKQRSPAHVTPIWSDRKTLVMVKHAGFLIEQRQLRFKAPKEVIYQALMRMHAEADLEGGTGLNPGGVLDGYWVDELKPEVLLRLSTESRMGTRWIEWRLQPLEDNDTRLLQTVYFLPRYWVSFLYWYVSYPLYRLMFKNCMTKVSRYVLRIQFGEL